MKFLDLLEDNTEKSIIKRGKLIYEHLRIGHIIYSNTSDGTWDLEPLKIGYTLPEKYDVGVYKDSFPMITFYDEVEYDVPEGFYEDNDIDMNEFGELDWIQDIQEKFWKKHRIVLIDDNFGEILDLRKYLRDLD